MSPDAPSSRDKILDVAEVLFARRGFAGVGMRELADASGLRKSSLFHHFRSKAQIYYEVLARQISGIHQRLAPVLALEARPDHKLERWIDAVVDALAENPPSARLLLRALVEDDGMAGDLPPEAEAAERVLAETLQGIHRLLREGVEQGVFRDVSVPHTVQTLIGATVYHFASGELGENLLGRPLLSAEAVRRRKEEVRGLMRLGLLADPQPAQGEPS